MHVVAYLNCIIYIDCFHFIYYILQTLYISIIYIIYYVHIYDMILYKYLFNYNTRYISYHTITSYALPSLPHDPSRSLTTIIIITK